MKVSPSIVRGQILAEALSTHDHLGISDIKRALELLVESSISDEQIVLISLLLNLSTKTGTYALKFNLTVEDIILNDWSPGGQAKLLRIANYDFNQLYPELDFVVEHTSGNLTKKVEAWINRINLEYSSLYMAFNSYSHSRPIIPLTNEQKQRLPSAYCHNSEDDLFSHIYATTCSIEQKLIPNPFYSDQIEISVSIPSKSGSKSEVKIFSLDGCLIRKIIGKPIPTEVNDYLEANYPVEIELYRYHKE